MNKVAIDNLARWAEGRSTERARFVSGIVPQLRDEKKRPTLSLLDLRREIESHPDTRIPKLLRTISRFMQPIVVAAYLIPVGYTWWELRDVLGQFSNDETLEDGVSLISFWTGQEGTYAGTPLQSVGMTLVLILLGVLLAQLFVDYVQDPGTAITPELNSILFEVQLDLAQTQVFTPKEFTNTISAAARELEGALTTITSTVNNASMMIAEVARTTDGLREATLTIGEVSTRLQDAIQPIINLESTLRKTDDALRASTDGIREMHALIDSSSQHLSNINQNTTRIGSVSADVSEAAGNLMRQVEAAAQVMQSTARGFSQAVQSSSQIAQRLQEVLDLTDDRSAQLLSIREIAVDIREASALMATSVHEIKLASERFVEVNSQISSAIKENLDGFGL